MLQKQSQQSSSRTKGSRSQELRGAVAVARPRAVVRCLPAFAEAIDSALIAAAATTNKQANI